MSPSQRGINRPHQPRIDRRAMLGATGAALVGLTACAGGAAQSDPTMAPATSTNASANTPAALTPATAATTPIATQGQAAAIAGSVSEGFALVTSPRLPLFGVGAAQVDALMSGEITNWQAVGSAVSLPVEWIAFADGDHPSVAPVETAEDYDALTVTLGERPGGVAVVPLDQVDFRVNVLSVEGVDPLRDRESGASGPITRVGFVGDIVPGRNVGIKMRTYGDYTYPFHDVAVELASYDLTIANLEGNLSDAIAPPDDPNTFDFVCDPAMLDGFRLAGIDAVSLANNHTTWNESGWGVQALLDTLAALDAAEMPRFGAGRSLEEARQVWSTEINGLRFGFLSVDGVTGNLEYPYRDKEIGTVGADWAAGVDSPGTNPYLMAQLAADVSAAAASHDVVIPYLHMGAEYQWIVPEWVVAAAHAAIDAGATMVVTNHPHIIQGMEVYAGRPIIYSVGNFIFDQMFSVDTREGFILEITLDGAEVAGIRLRGVEIEDFCQPRLMTAGEQAAIMDRFWRSTDILAER